MRSLQAELDAAHADCLRLDAARAETQAELDAAYADGLRLDAARAVTQAELEAVHADRVRLEAALQELRQSAASLETREHDAREERDGLQVRLDLALATCQQYEAALSQQEAAHRDLAAAHAASVAERAAAIADRDRLVRTVREHAAQMAALADQLVPAADAKVSTEKAAGMPGRRGGR